MKVETALVASALVLLLGLAGCDDSGPEQSPEAQANVAVTKLILSYEPDRDGLVTVWDGNKYVQCRRCQSVPSDVSRPAR